MNIRHNQIIHERRDRKLQPGAARIADFAQPIDLQRASDAELSDVLRVGSAIMLAVREEYMRRAKTKMTSEWKRAPGSPSPYEMPRSTWADHCQTVKKRGRKVGFMSFPYNIDVQGLRDLVKIADGGWDVFLWGSQDVYFPGETIPVAIRPKGGTRFHSNIFSEKFIDE